MPAGLAAVMAVNGVRAIRPIKRDRDGRAFSRYRHECRLFFAADKDVENQRNYQR